MLGLPRAPHVLLGHGTVLWAAHPCKGNSCKVSRGPAGFGDGNPRHKMIVSGHGPVHGMLACAGGSGGSCSDGGGDGGHGGASLDHIQEWACPVCSKFIQQAVSY